MICLLCGQENEADSPACTRCAYAFPTDTYPSHIAQFIGINRQVIDNKLSASELQKALNNLEHLLLSIEQSMTEDQKQIINELKSVVDGLEPDEYENLLALFDNSLFNLKELINIMQDAIEESYKYLNDKEQYHLLEGIEVIKDTAPLIKKQDEIEERIGIILSLVEKTSV